MERRRTAALGNLPPARNREQLLAAASPVQNCLLDGEAYDPVLVLYSGLTPIASNDNWQSAGNAGQLQSMNQQPAHPSEAAILITLQPGVYTTMVRTGRRASR